jgi:hypothetical protein
MQRAMTDESVLDDDERQSIREWFRRLARLRGPTDASDPEADDLPVPPDLARDVRGGTQSGSPYAPRDDESDG